MISKGEVARIAELARLDVDEGRRELFAEQLSSILQYMETLNELDTSDVEPLYSPVEHDTPVRQDEPETRCSRDEVLGNAPETDGKYFIVPKVV
jgi:aspartyl-tRNA(Asn)/glutamyl-tRNA(Gln) amidotransferase subunit C